MHPQKNAIPLDWINRSGEVCRLGELAALHVWNKIIDAGYDPTKLNMRFAEVGDGTLGVGCFESEKDDIKNPIPGLGFIIPAGFWFTNDGRVGHSAGSPAYQA